MNLGGLYSAALILYVMLIALASLLVADFIFTYTYKPLRYIEAKTQLEKALAEYKAVEKRRDKRAERKIRKVSIEVASRRRTVTRASLYRLLLLLPLYFASVLSTASVLIPLPTRCCPPVIAVATKKGCFLESSLILLISYLAFFPLIQESFFSMTLARRILKTRRT
ncbi:MAG: hypothetical protein ABWW69_00105 [Pyrodictiaceae archaeon]